MAEMKCKICSLKMEVFIEGIFDNRHGYPGRFDIYRCKNCGFYSTYPQPTNQELDRLYTDYYPRSGLNPDQVKASATQLKTPKDKLAIWLNGTGNSCHFHAMPGMRVLDYGCGTGASLLEIRSLGADAYGIEVDENIRPVAKALGLNMYIGSLEDSPYPDQFFDLITLNQVIEHIPDPLTFLLAVKTKLKQDGKIMLSCPNPDSLSRRLIGKKWLHWHVPYHLNHFSKTSLKRLLEQAGLNVTNIRVVTPNLWTVLQLRLLVAKVEEGQRDTSWDLAAVAKKESRQINTFDRLLLKLTSLLSGRFKFMLVLYNRPVDLLGMGDSFVVEARIGI